MRRLWFALSVAMLFSTLLPTAANAEDPMPFPGTVVAKTNHSYAILVNKLVAAVAKHSMGVVARASATEGAKKIGVTIPGNQVIMVFHPKYAVRMLKASVPAGIEAPLRYYIMENDDHTATLLYRTPSSVFSPYDNADLNKMALELDTVFARIATDAVR